MSKKIKGKVKIGLLILFTLLSVSLLLINHKDVQSSGTNYTIDVPTTWTQTVDCGILTVNSTLTLDSSAGTPITINADSITVNAGGKISADAKGYSGGTALSNVSFIDSETTAKTVTPNGNAQISNVQSKFGGGAAYFDGTGDYLSLADSDDWSFGSGDFTVDMWVKTTITGSQGIVGQWDSGNLNWAMQLTGTNKIRFNYSANGSVPIGEGAVTTTTLSPNTWYHIAVVRSGNSVEIYINGVASLTIDVTGVALFNSTVPLTVGNDPGAGYFTGFIDEVRISKGIARWTSNFTPPTAPYTTDSYIKLLMHMNGCTDGSGTGAGIGGAAFSSTQFKDSEDIAKTLTANGNAQLSPVQGKFGGSSAYFDGSGDYLTLADNADWDFGSGDFTVDFWLRFNTVAPAEFVGQIDSVGNNTSWLIFYDQENGLRFVYSSNGATIISLNCSWTPSANTWYHIAAVRSGTTLKVYVNGTQVGSTGDVTGVTIYNSTLPLRVGFGESYYLNGYIDELRISKGTARWTSNFTPPTAPYTSDSYTRLLLHADGSGAGGAAYVAAGGNGVSGAGGTTTYGSATEPISLGSGGGGAGFSSATFIDSETTPKIVTANGDAKITNAQSKFGAVSAYFDGTGDYLSLADSDDWSFGTGDFTIDFWYRATALNDLQVFASQYGGGENWRVFRYNDWQDSNRLWLEFYAGSAMQGQYKTTDGWSLNVNQWYHLAFVRNGTTVKIFIDGVSQALTEVYAIGTNDVGNIVSSLHVGEMAGEEVNGYLDEFRISKGIARWTENFTPPTEPYTSDSYTKLLLHMGGGQGAGGAGAGAMKLVVAGTLTNDGTISANGADGVIGGGAGSGGSIWAICNTLAGSGSFSANGGSGGGAGGAGSGGRIRLSPSAANTFSGTTTMSAGTGCVTSSGAAASGTLSSAKITTASVVAGATSNTTINFTTVSAVPTNGTIEVDFPSGYDLSGTLAYVSNTGVTGSNITLSVTNGNTLVITLGSGTSISANTAVSIVVSGIKNPNLLGSTGTFTIRTKTAAGAIIDQVVGTSLAVDKITVPTLTISSPNGTEDWAVGSSHNITWTYNGTISNNLSLYYATDGGTSYNTIVSGRTNSGTYSWTVPAVPAPGTTNKVKIQDTFYQTFTDTQNTDFTGGTLYQTATSGTGGAGSVILGLDTGLVRTGTYTVGTHPDLNSMVFDPSSNSIWVTNSGSNNVSKLSATDGHNVNTYTVGSNPVGITFDSLTNSVWVSNRNDATVTRIRVSDGSILTVALNNPTPIPRGIGFDPISNSVWVIHEYQSARFYKIRCSDGVYLGTTSEFGWRNDGNVVFESSTNSIWAASGGWEAIVKLNPQDGTYICTQTSVSLGNITMLTFDSSTNSIWAIVDGSTAVRKIRCSDFNVVSYTSGGNTPSGIAFDSVTNSIWVTNYGTNIVRKLRASDGTWIADYPTHTNPYGAVFNPITNSVWVENYDSNNVDSFRVLDIVKAGDYSTGTNPDSIAFDSSTNSVWVTNAGSANVSKLSATNGTISGTYNVGSSPWGIAFDSSTNSVWAVNRESANVSKLSATNGANLGNYGVGSYPASVAFDSSTNSIWVANYISSNVSKLQVSDGANLGTYTAGTNPQFVTFDSSTNSIWVGNTTSDNVSKLRASDGANLGTYTVGSAPAGVAFDSFTNSVWVVNSNSNTVSKLRASDGASLGTYSTGGSPWSVVFDSITNSVWVTNYGSSGAGTTVSKLQASNGTILAYYVVGTGPRGIAFDPLTNSIWVANKTSNTVSKLPVAPYYNSGNFTSRAIDVGASNTLSTLGYTATLPTNTTLKFQVAANNDNSTWSFVGTDGTANTYFTAPGTAIPTGIASSQYLKYKAFLTTSEPLTTPTLSDVSIGFSSTNSSYNTISDASNANFTITSASVGGTASITPASLVVGVTGNVTVAFTNVNPIPADGKIVVTFPAGFTLPSTGNYTATSSTIGGTLTPTTSSQTITITRSGGSSATAAAQSLTLSNIQNPVDTGTTGTYSLQTQSSAGYIIDSASNITGSTIVAVPLTLTSPDPAATQTFKAGTTQTITWTSAAASCPSSVNLKYSTDSGATYANVIATAVANAAGSNSYAWTVPGAAGTHVRIKVEDANNTQVFDASDVDLTIAYPSITITSPNGGESWAVGSTHNITWTSDSPAITAVKLEYSTDGGTTWNLITASAPNTGTYAWTLNGLFVTGQLKVRATGLAGFSSLTLSGTAASKMSGVAYLESSKTLFMDVLSDFSAGDTLVISGHKFCNFSVSDTAHLWLDLYDNGASDARIIQVSASSPVFSGGSSDGWAYAERALATF